MSKFFEIAQAALFGMKSKPKKEEPKKHLLIMSTCYPDGRKVNWVNAIF